MAEKINWEELESWVDTFDRLPLKAKTLLFIYNDMTIIDYMYNVNYCESPIEMILFVALKIYLEKTNLFLYIEPQQEINANGKKYYVDFCISWDEILNKELKEDFKLAIECDGHDFHQKTKEQVIKDNNREYDLKMSGYEVLRFSGSEIYKDPIKCAKKIVNYVLEKNHE